jgi:hypothetical protein
MNELNLNTITGQIILPGLENMKEDIDDATRRELMKKRESKEFPNGYLLYDELDADEQETARNWYTGEGYPYSDWYECVYAELQTIAGIIGINLDMERTNNPKAAPRPAFSFDLDRGRYFSFGGTYSYHTGWKAKAEKEFGKGIFVKSRKEPNLIYEFFTEFADTERLLQRPVFYTASIAIYTRNEGFYTTTEIPSKYTRKTEEKCSELGTELMVLFAELALDLLTREYEGLFEQAYVKESIRCNEYEFNLDGTRC